MTDTWLIVSEIEKETGIPDATIRRYIRVHGHHLKVKKQGKSYLFAKESLESLLKIRSLYQEGKQTEQVEKTLLDMHMPTVIDVNDGERSVTVNVTEALVHMTSSMNELNQKYEDLLEELQKQREHFDKKMEERDYELLQVLKELQETKSLTASSKQKSFWGRLFGK